MKIFIVLACLAFAYAEFEDDVNDKCRNGYKACAIKLKESGAKGKDIIKGRYACGNAYMKCRYAESGAKDKIECVKKCYAETKQCFKDGGKKVECMKKGYACLKKCKYSSPADVPQFDGYSNDKCNDDVTECIQILKDSGVSRFDYIKGRLACRSAYMKCRSGTGTKDRDCNRKCYAEIKQCFKDGSSKVECVKKLPVCLKKCRSA